MKKTFVISLGGSLIVPEKIDVNFLKKFKFFINSQVKKGNRFILVAGGGRTCRTYQDALKKILPVSNEDLDWLGIYATRFNAQLLQLIFKEIVHPTIVEDFGKKLHFKEKILIAGGWKPGRSSDGAMVKIAQTYGAHTVINLSNIDYVYTTDPKKFIDAQPIKNISWVQFLARFGSKWQPGANVPFDPTAALFAKKNNITVVVANGKNLKNLENILNGKKFVGTTIS